MQQTTVFNEDILSFLVGNNFKRTDDESNKSIMRWKRERTVIEFIYFDIIVKCELDDQAPHIFYRLHGFNPADSVAFSFLMNMWEIIPFNGSVKMVTGNNLAKSLEHINMN